MKEIITFSAFTYFKKYLERISKKFREESEKEKRRVYARFIAHCQ